MAIILVLAGLILSISGYVQKKGARSRAEAEIAAMSAALESYKADNGIYPTNATTNALDASADPAGGSPSNFETSGRYLYTQLAGDSDGNPATVDSSGAKNYMGGALKPNMLSPNPSGPGTYIRDPFGYCYGYSTAKAAAPSGTAGYNPTFDLWSTAGETAKKSGETFSQYQERWIKNW